MVEYHPRKMTGFKEIVMLKHIGLNCCLLSLLSFPLASQAESSKDSSTDIKHTDSIEGTLILKTPEPKTALEHDNRGIELGSKGLWVKAIKEHHLALLEEPTNKIFRTNLSSAHLQYGEVLLKKGKRLEADAQFHAALYIDPDNEAATGKLKDIGEPKARLIMPHTQILVPGELDEFLRGKADTLHGYDAF
jgi:tetratricopeptide (TPR) repeat protein